MLEPDALPARSRATARACGSGAMDALVSRAEFDATPRSTDDPIERARRTLLPSQCRYSIKSRTTDAPYRLSDDTKPGAGTIPHGTIGGSPPPVLLAIGGCACRAWWIGGRRRAPLLCSATAIADTLHYLDPPYLAETRNVTPSVRWPMLSIWQRQRDRADCRCASCARACRH